MRRFLIILWFGLLLLGCDKPDSREGKSDRSESGKPVPDRKVSHREPNPDAPASLRAQLDEAVKIESPAEREKAIARIAWNAIETESEIAHEAFRQLPPGSSEKIRLIQHYALRLAEQDPGEALAWADQITDEGERSAAIGQVAVALAETEPRRAAEMLSESGIVGRDFDVAVVQVIQRWAAQSAPDAAGWVTSFPPGEVRTAGIKVIAERWLAGDSKGAFDWLGGMQDEQLRNETARAMEGVILQQPQETRDAWLQHTNYEIRNELDEQRAQAIKDVGDNIPSPTD